MNRFSHRLRSALTAEARAVVAEYESAQALKAALEHVAAATKAAATLPDLDAAPEAHHKAVLGLHAHIKAADGYLEKAWSAGLLTSDPDADAASDAAVAADPEMRMQRETTRAHAATILLATGNIAGAQKLIRRTPTKPRRPR